MQRPSCLYSLDNDYFVMKMGITSPFISNHDQILQTITSVYRDHTWTNSHINCNTTYYHDSWPQPLLKGPLAPAKFPPSTSRNCQRLFHGCLLTNPVGYRGVLAGCYWCSSLFSEACMLLHLCCPLATIALKGLWTPTRHIDCKSKQNLGRCPFLPLCDLLCTPMSHSISVTIVPPISIWGNSLLRTHTWASTGVIIHFPSMPSSFLSFTFPQEF